MATARMPPVRTAFKRFVLYETQLRFYLVAYCPKSSSYGVMRIDRTDAADLNATVVASDLTRQQIDELLDMIHVANISRGGLIKSVAAVAVLGFIQFLQGYYLILTTQHRKVGRIGPHAIYMITGTVLIPISNASSDASNMSSGQTQLDEARYKSLISTLDLTDNFYFSHTYDLTRSLQSNMLHPDREPISLFIWNRFLLADCAHIDKTWFVHLVHGFFEQRTMSFFGGRVLGLTLISRRSTTFAGTRYLKRGINFEGYSANDVDTEQIVHDRNQGDVYDLGLYTSYVQHRASIPLYWTQEPNPMVARPDIILQLADPTVRGMRRHFEGLLERYGSPCICLNLIRQSESVARETTLGAPFRDGVAFLNQFAHHDHLIEFIEWDFKHVSKSRTRNVADDLSVIAEGIISRTGFFHSSLHDTAKFKQSGVCRSNCIDSLDRTNVAQYCIGKRALAHQLYHMGWMSSTSFPPESCLERLLLEMYERMGDCLALQYGGSQMHRQIKKDKAAELSVSVPVLYRLRPPNKPKELLISILRHYQNSFQDKDKQDAYNLFLGVYRPISWTTSCALWDIGSDRHLHNPRPNIGTRLHEVEPDITTPDWTAEHVNRFEASATTAVGPPVLHDSSLEAAEAYFDERYDTNDITFFDEELDDGMRSQSMTIYPVMAPHSQTGIGVVARLWRNFRYGGVRLDSRRAIADDNDGHNLESFSAIFFDRVTSPDHHPSNDLATTAFKFSYLSCQKTHDAISRYISGENLRQPQNDKLACLPQFAVVTGVTVRG